MQSVPVSAFARRHRLSRARIHQLIAQGRIPGAVLLPAAYRRCKPQGEHRGRWRIPLHARILPPLAGA